MKERKHLNAYLRASFTSEKVNYVFNSYDVIGDIAVIRVPLSSASKESTIAQAIMQVHNNVKTVLMQTGRVSGIFRTRSLEWIGGENKTLTVHREHGCLFEVDLARCYFSPRLSFERKRIANLVQPNEIVVNMFAGVGCFSVIMAKQGHVGKVFSIDLNSSAVEFMRKNARLNRVQSKIIPIHGDSEILMKNRLSHIADRILMPLPEKAYEYLDNALLGLKPKGGWVHYYDFVHATKDEEPVCKVKDKAAAKLHLLGVDHDIRYGRIVRTTGPNWFQVVLDILIKAQ